MQFPVMPGDGAPPDYSRLFGLTAGDFTPYGFGTYLSSRRLN